MLAICAIIIVNMANELSLSKPPVVDAIVELRFDSEMPSQVIAGILFDKLTKYGYGSFEEIEVARLPKEIKDSEASLRYAAHYRFSSDKFFVSISSRVISVVCKCVGESTYQGWDNYKHEIEKVLSELRSLSAVGGFSRVGVRFVNLFTNSDILERINIAIQAPDVDMITDERIVGFVYKNGTMNTRINFATKASLSFVDGGSMDGAVLDVDSYTEQEDISFDRALGLIEDGHKFTEAAFVKIVKKEFMDELR